MKPARLLLLLASLSLLLTACSANGLFQVTLITNGSHELAGDLPGDLLLLGGQATVPPEATLQGSAHLISGQLNVEGQILGDVTLMGGELVLGPSASLGGNLNVGGGSYQASPGALIAGRTHANAGIPLPELPERASPFSAGTLLRHLLNAVLLGLLAATLVRRFPHGIQRVGEAATRHSLVSAAVGLLVGVVGISLLVTMAYTILLIPVSLLGLLALGLGVVTGWIGLGVRAGSWAAHRLGRPLSPARSAFLGTLGFILLLELLSALPGVGGLLGIVVAATGLGAVSLTRFGLQRFVPVGEEEISI